MPADLAAGFAQSARALPADDLQEADAAACVASHAQDANDARLLLDALGLTEAAPLARAVLKLSRRIRPA